MAEAGAGAGAGAGAWGGLEGRVLEGLREGCEAIAADVAPRLAELDKDAAALAQEVRAIGEGIFQELHESREACYRAQNHIQNFYLQCQGAFGEGELAQHEAYAPVPTLQAGPGGPPTAWAAPRPDAAA